MDFSHLPDDVFLQIFEYFPIQDCARLGRVDKAFHRMSQLAISRTKFLDLTDDRFRNLSADQLAVILGLCSPILEKIQFPMGGYPRGVQYSTTLANYECPRLTDIILWNTPIDYAVLQQLIRNNSNLKSLHCRAEFVGFPAVTSKNLNNLYLSRVDDVTLQSMIGRIPNLEELSLIDTNVTANVLDEFFASSPRIQRVVLRLVDEDQIVFDESLANFWNLPLTSLAIKKLFGVVIPGDGVLQKMVTYFPRLQRLWMDVSKPTNHEISALAGLQELKILQLDISNWIYDIDDGFRALVACKQLRSLTVSQSISSGTLIALLRGCPQLEFVGISEINHVDTPDEAAVVLGSLAGIAKRGIIIRFDPEDDEEKEWLGSIWESEAAKEAIKNLERDEGFKVKIDWV